MKKNTLILLLLSLGFIGKANAQTALDFNGSNQWVDVGAISNFNTFTIEFDIQHQGADGTHDRFISNTNNGFSLATDGSGTVKLYSSNLGVSWTNIGYSMPVNTWQHMTWVYDGGTISLYVNGSYVNQVSCNGNQLNAANWYIAANQANFSENANVSIDNFRMWDDVRTASEISTEYQNCLTGSETNLIVLYDFEEGSGASVGDLAGGDNNGTVISGASWVAGVTCAVLGVSENDLGTVVKLYPNPTTGVFTLSFDEISNDLAITITDVIGKMVYFKRNVINKTLRLDIDHFNKGVYFVQIQNSNEQKVIKLIKQ